MIKYYCTNLPTPELLSCSLSSLPFLFTLILSLPLIFCVYFPITENFDYKISVTLECRLYAPNHPLIFQQTNKSKTSVPSHTTDNNRLHFCTSLWVIQIFFAALFFPCHV
ncbi:hypothetical protein J4Q44_G00059130 [Coregonus suidteri]|uniref:Uncharacterized protein n=1 Tax=Coregonus suidteri TaxID=861788 RepID=A0AAN8M6V9_9TELE